MRHSPKAKLALAIMLMASEVAIITVFYVGLLFEQPRVACAKAEQNAEEKPAVALPSAVVAAQGRFNVSVEYANAVQTAAQRLDAELDREETGVNP